MLGYPGAGKTTTAEIIHAQTGAIHLSSDKMRLEMFDRPTFSADEHDKLYAALDAQTEQLLSEGKSVIYDANLNRYQHRQEKYEICEKSHAEPVLIWLQTPRALAKERAMHDSRKQLIPKQETAADMFERIADIIEEPTANEQAIALDGSNVTRESVASALHLA